MAAFKSDFMVLVGRLGDTANPACGSLLERSLTMAAFKSDFMVLLGRLGDSANPADRALSAP